MTSESGESSAVLTSEANMTPDIQKAPILEEVPQDTSEDLSIVTEHIDRALGVNDAGIVPEDETARNALKAISDEQPDRIRYKQRLNLDSVFRRIAEIRGNIVRESVGRVKNSEGEVIELQRSRTLSFLRKRILDWIHENPELAKEQRGKIQETTGKLDECLLQMMQEEPILVDTEYGAVEGNYAVVDTGGLLDVNEKGKLHSPDGVAPVVLIGGMRGDIPNLESVTYGFAMQDRPVIVISPPNSFTGKLTKEWVGELERSRSLQLDADFYKSAIGGLIEEGQQIDIVGYSYGGLIAQGLSESSNGININNVAVINPSGSFEEQSNVSRGVRSAKELILLADPETNESFQGIVEKKDDDPEQKELRARALKVKTEISGSYVPINDSKETGRKVFVNGLEDKITLSASRANEQKAHGAVINVVGGDHIDISKGSKSFGYAREVLDAWGDLETGDVKVVNIGEVNVDDLITA